MLYFVRISYHVKLLDRVLPWVRYNFLTGSDRFLQRWVNLISILLWTQVFPILSVDAIPGVHKSPFQVQFATWDASNAAAALLNEIQCSCDGITERLYGFRVTKLWSSDGETKRWHKRRQRSSNGNGSGGVIGGVSDEYTSQIYSEHKDDAWVA